MYKASVRSLARWLSSIFAALFLPAWALAQTANVHENQDLTQISLEDLAQIEIFSASKHLQKSSEAPSSISIVTADDIRRYGYRNFAEVLKSVTGFYVANDRNYSYLGVRGFGRPGDYNSRILILINGHRLNENIYGGNGLGYDFVPDLSVIDRIEFVRGPGSSLYGTNAFFGVVNIITKEGHSEQEAMVSTDAGSQDTYSTRASYGARFKSGLEMFVAGAYFNSKGYRRLYYPEYDAPETNNGIAEDADAERWGSAFANFKYKDFSAQFAYNSRDKTIPTASFGTIFNDRRNYTTDERGMFDFKFEHTYRKAWEVTARTSYDFYRYSGAYIYASSDAPFQVRNEDFATGDWGSADIQIARPYRNRHRISGGAEVNYSFRANQLNYDVDPSVVYANDRRQPSNVGLFLQEEFRVSSKMLLNAGFRYDRYSTFGGTTNPRLGLIFEPTGKTTFKLLYGRAFRAPSVFELYYFSLDTKASPNNLDPETVRTCEAVAEHYFGSRIKFSASAFFYQISGLISQLTDPASGLLYYDNLNKIRAKGLEFEVSGKGFRGIDGRLSYSVQQAKSLTEDEDLSNSPRHMARLNLALPLLGKGSWATTELSYMSSRKTLGGRIAGGFFLADIAFLKRNLFPNLDLSIGVYNLFNKRYGDPGGEEHLQEIIQQDGRTFRIRLSYSIPFSASRNAP